MRPRRTRRPLALAALAAAGTLFAASAALTIAQAAAAPPGYCASALRGAAGACQAELAALLAPPATATTDDDASSPSLSRACCSAAVRLFSRGFQRVCGWCEPSVARKARRAGIGAAALKRGAALVARGCGGGSGGALLPAAYAAASAVVPPPDACPSGEGIEEEWAAILGEELGDDGEGGAGFGASLIAPPRGGPSSPRPGAAAAASSAGAASAVAATPELPPPDFGQGAVCGGTSTKWGTCYVKCADSPDPTEKELAEARACDSSFKGWCDGADGDGRPSDERGAAVCGEGRPAPDPEHPDEGDPQARPCFRCCTVWKPKQVGKPYVDACRPLGSSWGGGKKGKGGGGSGGAVGVGGGGGGGGGGCFPGDATATLESGARVAMRDLQIGDRVLSADPRTGRVSFEDVYFFGHQLPGAAGDFVRLEVEGEEDEEGEGEESGSGGSSRPRRRAIELSPKHLVPTLPGPVYKRAADVAVGDVVMVVVDEGGGGKKAAAAARAREARVVAAASPSPAARPGAGLFAPFTAGGGHLVVDGVVASVHSDWILDPLFERLGRVSSLHGAYERLYGGPLRFFYRAAGARAMRLAGPLVAGLAAADGGAQLARALSVLRASVLSMV